MKIDKCPLSEGKSAYFRLIRVDLAFNFFLVSATFVQEIDTVTFLHTLVIFYL